MDYWRNKSGTEAQGVTELKSQSLWIKWELLLYITTILLVGNSSKQPQNARHSKSTTTIKTYLLCLWLLWLACRMILKCKAKTKGLQTDCLSVFQSGWRSRRLCMAFIYQGSYCLSVVRVKILCWTGSFFTLQEKRLDEKHLKAVSVRSGHLTAVTPV